MSEPLPEEVEEPAADLEELLEQFREPEAPPKKRANPLWVVSALLLAVLACWLALRASGGSAEEKPKSAALAGERLPGKVSQRTMMREVPVNMADDYLARCKKGMTAREVRWIVEDFQKSGLGEVPLSDDAKIAHALKDPARETEGKANAELAARLTTASLECARIQRAWYGDALADGLRLDPAQRKVLKERLDAALAEDREQFENRVKALLLYLEAASPEDPALTADLDAEIERLIGGPSLDVAHGFFEGLTYADFPGAPDWLADERYAPWVLCDLSPDQEAVTRRAESEEEEERVAADQNEQDVVWTSTWLDLATPFRSGLAERREIHIADGDFGPLAAAGSIFPLEEVQLFEGDEFVRINDPTRLHPAQLKLLLLLEPERAAQILQALEKADE